LCVASRFRKAAARGLIESDWWVSFEFMRLVDGFDCSDTADGIECSVSAQSEVSVWNSGRYQQSEGAEWRGWGEKYKRKRYRFFSFLRSAAARGGWGGW